MAAPRLLAKTDLTAYAPVLEAGRPVIEQHAKLAALLAARGIGAGLFAEPVITRGADGAPASVSWYGETDADPVPLSSLSPARRAEAERMLAAATAALQPALDDPDAGGLLRRALLLAEPDSVLAVDSGIMLAGWGLVPRGTEQAPAPLAARLAAGLGRYHPALAAAGAGFFTGAPVAAAAAPPSAGAAPGAAATPSPAHAAPTPSAPPPPPPPPVSRAAPAGRPAWWWLVPAALVIALLFLLLGVWLGLRMCSSQFAGVELQAGLVNEAETRAAIERQRAANARLEREIEAARAALQGEICRPAGPLAPFAPPAEGQPPQGQPPQGQAPQGQAPAGAAPASGGSEQGAAAGGTSEEPEGEPKAPEPAPQQN